APVRVRQMRPGGNLGRDGNAPRIAERVTVSGIPAPVPDRERFLEAGLNDEAGFGRMFRCSRGPDRGGLRLEQARYRDGEDRERNQRLEQREPAFSAPLVATAAAETRERQPIRGP